MRWCAPAPTERENKSDVSCRRSATKGAENDYSQVQESAAGLIKNGGGEKKRVTPLFVSV